MSICIVKITTCHMGVYSNQVFLQANAIIQRNIDNKIVVPAVSKLQRLLVILWLFFQFYAFLFVICALLFQTPKGRKRKSYEPTYSDDEEEEEEVIQSPPKQRKTTKPPVRDVPVTNGTAAKGKKGMANKTV